MRVILCVTLPFLLISHASIRFPTSSASPLPSIQHREMLDSTPQDFLIRVELSPPECNHEMARLVNLNNELLDGHRRPKARGRTTASHDPLRAAFNEGQYPYPTATSTTKRSRTRARHSSTKVDAGMASTSMAPGTLFVTTSYPSAPSQFVHHATLSPLRPLYDMGRSSMQVSPSQSHSSPLPWVLGILIPFTLAVLIWLAICRSQRRKKRETGHAVVPSDSYASETSDMNSEVPSEKVGLGIRFEGWYNPSSMLTLPPVSIQPLDFEARGLDVQNQGRQMQEMVDCFELKAAVFPTRNELCHYVFPSTAAAVEREVQAAKRMDSQPTVLYSSSSSTRIITATRPVNLTSNRVIPKTFSSRIQTTQRKRFSPIGEVLYSTGGVNDPLETVQEELTVEDVLNSPKVAYKGGEGEFAAGPRNEQVPLTCSTSYGSTSPVGLRARRKSSPLIPEVMFRDVDRSPVPIEFTSVAPLQINKTKRLSPSHHRSATKSEVFGWDMSSGLGTIPSLTGAPSAADEERKFTEFVKSLVRNADAQKRSRQIQALTFNNEFERQVRSSFNGTIDRAAPGLAGKKEKEFGYTGRHILLPPPSIGAALSDFSMSSSTLASDVPSSESRFSIGVAL